MVAEVLLKLVFNGNEDATPLMRCQVRIVIVRVRNSLYIVDEISKSLKVC